MLTTLFLPLLLLTACQQIVKSEMLEVDPFEVSAGKLDLTDTELTTKYCVGNDLECPGENLDSYYAPDIQQCMAKCSRNLECLSAFYKNKQCYSRKLRCPTDKLIDSAGGIDLLRLQKKEQCPENRPQWEKPNYNFSRRFCVYRGKYCQGYNLYKRPLKIADLMECLQKCTRILSCAGVDFSPNQCSPKEYQCKDDELSSSDLTGNYMRLKNDENECPENREEPVVVPEPTPKVNCPENSERKSETGTVEDQCECNEGFLMHEGTCFEQGTAGGGLRPTDYKFCPGGSKRISETGTYADQCECEDGYSLVSETEDEAECVLIGTAGGGLRLVGEDFVFCPEDSIRLAYTGSWEEQCQCDEGLTLMEKSDSEAECVKVGTAGGGLRLVGADFVFCLGESTSRVAYTGSWEEQCQCEEGLTLIKKSDSEAECVRMGTAGGGLRTPCQDYEKRTDAGACECKWGTKSDGSCQTTEPDCPPLSSMEMGQCKCVPPAEMHWEECFAPFECTVGETIQGKALYRTDEERVEAGSSEACGKACSERAECKAASWLGGTQCLIHTRPLSRNLYDYGGRSMYCNSSPIPP